MDTKDFYDEGDGDFMIHPVINFENETNIHSSGIDSGRKERVQKNKVMKKIGNNNNTTTKRENGADSKEKKKK